MISSEIEIGVFKKKKKDIRAPAQKQVRQNRLRENGVGSTPVSHRTTGRGAAFLLPCARRSNAIRLMYDGSECSGIAASKSHEF